MADMEKHGSVPDTSSNGEADLFYDPDAGLTEEEKKKEVCLPQRQLRYFA